MITSLVHDVYFLLLFLLDLKTVLSLRKTCVFFWKFIDESTLIDAVKREYPDECEDHLLMCSQVPEFMKRAGLGEFKDYFVEYGRYEKGRRMILITSCGYCGDGGHITPRTKLSHFNEIGMDPFGYQCCLEEKIYRAENPGVSDSWDYIAISIYPLALVNLGLTEDFKDRIFKECNKRLRENRPESNEHSSYNFIRDAFAFAFKIFGNLQEFNLHGVIDTGEGLVRSGIKTRSRKRFKKGPIYSSTV